MSYASSDEVVVEMPYHVPKAVADAKKKQAAAVDQKTAEIGGNTPVSVQENVDADLHINTSIGDDHNAAKNDKRLDDHGNKDHDDECEEYVDCSSRMFDDNQVAKMPVLIVIDPETQEVRFRFGVSDELTIGVSAKKLATSALNARFLKHFMAELAIEVNKAYTNPNHEGNWDVVRELLKTVCSSLEDAVHLSALKHRSVFNINASFHYPETCDGSTYYSCDDYYNDESLCGGTLHCGCDDGYDNQDSCSAWTMQALQKDAALKLEQRNKNNKFSTGPIVAGVLSIAAFALFGAHPLMLFALGAVAARLL